MSQILFRGTSVEQGKAVRYGLLIALALVALVFAIVGYVAGKRAPDGMTAVAPYFLVGGLVLLVCGLWIFYSVRGDLFVTKGTGNALGVTLLNSKRKKGLNFSHRLK